MPRLRISRSIYEQIKNTIGAVPAEQGGILGGDRRNFVVRHFQLDENSNRSNVTYSPDYQSLNQLLNENWNPSGINLLGFVHSHPAYLHQPSRGDITYARRILQANPKLPYLLLPIVISTADRGKFEMHPYAAVRKGKGVRIVKLALSVIGGEMVGQHESTLLRLWELIWLLPISSWLIYRIIRYIKQKQTTINRRYTSIDEKRT